jgi:hypothetical protein
MASDQSMNTKEYQGDNDDTINFFSEVHLLAGKLVPVAAIHSLGDHVLIGITRLTRNRVPHNQHKMRIQKSRTIH